MVTSWPWRTLGSLGQLSQQIWQRMEQRLSDPRLYPLLRRNPITRWVTRHRTARLYDLMSGFANTQVLLACLRLGVFDALARSPQSLSGLAAHTTVSEPRLQPLLEAARSMRLLKRQPDDRYALAALAWPLLSHPGLQAMVEHNQLLYEDLLAPERFLREGGGRMQAFWPYVEGAAPATDQTVIRQASERYSELMDLSQVFVVEEVIASHDFSSHTCVMDVGCGMGRFLNRLGHHCPDLLLKGFDLPPVVALAKERLSNSGLGGRFEAHAGSFKTDDLPCGADLITLVRIGHDHGDEVVAQLLRKAWQALPIGGQVLLAEPMASSELDQARASAYFHLYLLAMGDGHLRQPDAYVRMLHQAGFGRVRRVKTGLSIHAQVILATKLG